MLFYARQKHQDLLTQQAVSIQGYLAIDLVRKNNLELIKGVDRAATTTVAALRTAVVVAQALANQKLVLDQITALNTTTSKLIESTSELLATQSVDINKQAASTTIGLESLHTAFANIYQSMDAIDTFKTQALDSMAQTVTALETEIATSQAYLAARPRRRRPRRRLGARRPRSRRRARDVSAPVATARAEDTSVGTDPDRQRLAAQVATGSAVAVGATAVACAALGVLGAVPATIGIVLAAPVYAAGHLAAHSLRRRRATVAVAGPTPTPPRSRRSTTCSSRSAGKVPATVEARVQRVAGTVRKTLPRLDQLGGSSEQAHAVVRTATSYMPEAVAAYLRLPRDFADRRAISGGKTSLTILCDQLDLLGSKMDDVFDAACRADADALIAHGRFLAEKFSTGALALDPQRR